MEVEEDIAEEIEEHLDGLEEAEEVIYTDDEELDKEIDITDEIRDSDVNDQLEGEEVKGQIIKDSQVDKDIAKNALDSVGESTIAVLQFSDNLAENILKEAVLISDIYLNDSLNVTTKPGNFGDKLNVMNRNIARKLPGGRNENGYDRYLLDKLLRSKPDMSEQAELYDEFNGEEVNVSHYMDDIEPDPDKCNLDVNDKNNNQLDANTISMVSDNFLETIHEDTELMINHPEDDDHDPQREKTPTPKQKGAEDLDKTEVKAEAETEVEAEADRLILETETEKSEKVYDSHSSADEQDDEIDCCEMTFKEKKAVVKAVRQGDIDKVELLLEKRHADLDLVWYGENLLMVALRADQESMAEFLIDNGIDLSYTGKLMERSDADEMTVFTYTARDIAFDNGMDDIVEVIDFKTNNLFPFVKPKEREIRLRRPRPPTPTPTPEEEMDEDIFYDPEEDVCLLKNPYEQKSEFNSESRLSGSRLENESRHASRNKREHGAHTGTSITSKFEDESEVTMVSEKHSEYNDEFHDDISHVFGQDEGYETMSPVSPVAMLPVHKLERNFIGTKEYVSVRGTRSSHSMRVRNSASKDRSRSESDSVQDYFVYPIQSVGSYNHESKRWHQTKSAPVTRNYSVESIPDATVRIGFPFVHGHKDRSKSSSAKSDSRQRSQSARSNLSPYAQVARLLSETKLLNSNSSSSFTHLPEVKTEALVQRKHTRTSYTCIYANTKSSIPGRTIFAHSGSPNKSELLDIKRKARA